MNPQHPQEQKVLLRNQRDPNMNLPNLKDIPRNLSMSLKFLNRDLPYLEAPHMHLPDLNQALLNLEARRMNLPDLHQE